MIVPVVRREREEDLPGIRTLNEQAFGGPKEAALVDALREHRAVTLSLVAAGGDRIVGHILFSPAEILGENRRTPAVALGPMAVLPGEQRRGIGSRLVEEALHVLEGAGHRLVIVLGHPRYYPRFGFRPASTHGIRCPYDVPDEVFMARTLGAGKVPAGGTARYRPEFDAAGPV